MNREPAQTNMAAPRRLRVLELYSGIGGMHCALSESGIQYEVVQAMDVNTVTNQIYRHNFPETKVVDRSIEVLTVEELDRMKIDMILMSPPCQPFTRVGKKKDSEDVRTSSFLHLLNLLPRLKCPVSYVLVENVKGFETSDTRSHLIDTLNRCDFCYQEMLLTPLQFGIPNSRLRYFLIGKRKPNTFSFQPSVELMEELPSLANKWLKHRSDENIGRYTCKCPKISQQENMTDGKNNEKQRCFHSASEAEVTSTKSDPISSCDTRLTSSEKSQTVVHIESDTSVSHSCAKKLKLSNSIVENNSDAVSPALDVTNRCLCESVVEVPSHCLENYGQNMRQVASKQTHRQCQALGCYLECDTQPVQYLEQFLLRDKDLQRYGHFMEGAGSVIQMTTDIQAVIRASEFKQEAVDKKNRSEWGESEMSVIRSLRLRYFTPIEIARVLCFPKLFSFPPGLTNKQLYRVLGNSLNVHVVAVLINFMLEGDIL